MKRTWLLGLAMAAALAMPAMSEEGATRVGDPYPLDVCAVAGEPLGSMGEPVVHVKDGREVKFCCAGCIKKYDAMTEQFNAAVDEKIIAQQAYPLTTCINSGAELGENARTFVAGNRVMKTCCGNCEKAVKADPAKYIEKLDAAVKEKQAADYSSTTCPVSGATIEGNGTEVVVANRLVRLCCGGCKDKLLADVPGALAKLDGRTEEAPKE
jgi:hypothetical protein